MNSESAETSSKRRRDKLHIMAEILAISKDGTLKTPIMHKANLSFAQVNYYTKFMTEINLIMKTENYKKKGIYKATEKGLDFLQRHREITHLLKIESENAKKVQTFPQNACALI